MGKHTELIQNKIILTPFVLWTLSKLCIKYSRDMPGGGQHSMLPTMLQHFFLGWHNLHICACVPPMKDDLRRKTNFDGTKFYERDDGQWKTTFNGR